MLSMGTVMGSLKPGATYIYESEGGRVYAREFGSPIRQLIGENFYSHHRYSITQFNDILKMCDTDPAMKQLWEQLLIMYNLKKTQ